MTWRVIEGDCRTALRALPEASVQTVVTSPPYWSQRDYGHTDQIGLEQTPAVYVAELVAVFTEVWRVLKDDGTLWINIGDAYTSGNRKNRDPGQSKFHKGQLSFKAGGRPRTPPGMKPKDLIGLPWMVAFALRDAGWYLRAENIWHKPNQMPRSVKDRTTRAHEQVFMLSKSRRYYYNHEAILEPYAESTLREARDGYNGTATKAYDGTGAQDPSATKRRIIDSIRKQDGVGKRTYAGFNGRWDNTPLGKGANKRSVWTIPTQPTREEHFAAFPEQLVEPCVLAGSRPGDTVLDPFCGIGRAGIVAVRLQRHFVGVELNPKYARIARRGIGSVAPLLAQEVAS